MMKHLLYAFSLRKMRFTWLMVIGMVGLGISLSTTRPAHAAVITVTTHLDVVDANPVPDTCVGMTIADLPGPDGLISLREAICATNTNAGADSITFNSSLDSTPIILTITTEFEDDAWQGDLDVKGDLTITGNGASQTIIDATAMSDRVFQLFSGITVEFNDLTIQGGNRPGGSTTMADSGAGLLSQATTTLNRVRITGNTATYRGGGVYNWGGTMVINNSTIDANISTTSGGGIFVDGEVSTANVTLTNSTLSGNSAGGSGGGLAVYSSLGTASLNHVTVAYNHADTVVDGDTGGGISNIPGVNGILNIKNTLIAGNTVGGGGPTSQCSGPITSQNYNWTEGVEGVSGCIFSDAGNDAWGTDPGLISTLADNGGPTLTHALKTTSDVVDLIPNGLNGCGSVPFNADQRGLTRPIDGDGDSSGQCDVGALESLQACQVTAGSSYILGTVSFQIPLGNAGTIDCFLVTSYDKTHPNATVPLQTGKYWQLDAFTDTGSAASGYNLNLKIAVPFTPDADDKLCRYTGSGWDCGLAINHTFTTSPDTITRNGVTQLSPWTGGNNAGPTSLTLQTLTARSATLPIVITAFALASIILLLFAWRKKTAPERQ